MHKRDYFLKALRAGAFRYKKWVIQAFSITRNDYVPEDVQEILDHFPYELHFNASGYFFFDPEDGHKAVFLEGCLKGEPAFAFREEVVVAKGELDNLDRGVTTTYGNLLANQTLLVYPFGNKIPYMEGRIDIPRIEKVIERRLQDNPKAGGVEDPNAIYVHEYQRYNEAALSLAGFTQLCVASATPKTMTTDPKIKVRREELLKQYADRLHDPVIQAKIDQELIAMDKAWLKGDPGEGFYIKDKSYDVVRKKTFLLQGAEQGFDVAGEVIPTSLNEGWDIQHLPAMGNSLREGSYNRGALTALGGEATKFNYRIFQNTVVSEEDCGSPYGMEVVIPAGEAAAFVSSSVITPKGLVELTEANIQQYVDRKVLIRSPIYCRTQGANFCATCIGKKIATTPHGISTYAADIGSTFMGIMLKSMHGKSLSIAEFEIDKAIN